MQHLRTLLAQAVSVGVPVRARVLYGRALLAVKHLPAPDRGAGLLALQGAQDALRKQGVL